MKHGLLRLFPERSKLRRRKSSAGVVHNRQHSNRVPLFGGDLHACIKSDIELRKDERIAGEARIFGRVRNYQRRLLLDRDGVEAHAARQLRQREAGTRLEPLPAFIDECQERDRRFAYSGRPPDDLVEDRLRQRVHDRVFSQRL